MQIKTTRYDNTSTVTGKILKTNETKWWQDAENYPSLVEMCNNSTIALKTSLAVSFKTNIHFLMIPEIPLLVTHPEVVKTRICTKTST